MKTIAEITGQFGYKAVLLKLKNGRYKIEISGNIGCEMNNKKKQVCSVSKKDVESYTYSDGISLQGLISEFRNKFIYK